MSIKFPKLYKTASQLLQLASEEDINVKHLLYNDKKYQHFNIKSLYAIVTKALTNWDIIQTLIKESDILTEHRGLNVWRIRVIISELVIGQKEFPNPENYTIQTVIQYEEQFKEILKKQTKSLNGNFTRNETDVAKVRFIKINLIKNNVKSVIERFQEDGWEKLETPSNYKDYLYQLSVLEPNSSVFLQDFHFKEVLTFPPGTELQGHELYTNGSVFFMDKASCLAPYLLAPKQNSHVLDMCAAPGLKTIQLASNVTSGKVYAVEKDAERYNTLQMMIEQSGAENVETVLSDVTKIKLAQYKHVEYILVDPSCTGSGIRKRQPSAIFKDRVDEKTRVEKLSGFQLVLLRFALTRFPAAKRVVYSTCSLNKEENEKVVEAALNSYYHNFDIVSVQNKLPEWQNFGSKDFYFGNKCIYCLPEIDQTNGFFVAVFERKKSQSDIFVQKKSQPDFYGLNNENSIDERENTLKGKKRRICEDNYDSMEKSSHKMLKHNNIKAEENGKSKTNAVKSLVKSKTKQVNTSGETNQTKTAVITKQLKSTGGTKQVKTTGKKPSLSEKKRSRKKILKIKKKILPQSNKHENSKDKSKKLKTTNEVKGSVRNICNESSSKVSKAMLRQKRKKLLKLNLASGKNAKGLKKPRDKSDLQVNSKVDVVKRKKKIINCSPLNENLNDSSEILNTSLKTKTNKDKRKKDTIDLMENEIGKGENDEGRERTFKSKKSNSSKKPSDENENKDSSKIIEMDESPVQTLERKHKKNKSLKHSNINIDEELYNVNGFEEDEIHKNVKNISSFNLEDKKEGSKKKKRKKKHFLDDDFVGSSKAIPEDVNDSASVNESATRSGETEDGGTVKKKQKIKHSSVNCDGVMTSNIYDLDQTFTENPNDITSVCTKTKLREEKGILLKKRKEKLSWDHLENNIAVSGHDESTDTAVVSGISYNNEEEKTQKKKHKTKFTSDNL